MSNPTPQQAVKQLIELLLIIAHHSFPGKTEDELVEVVTSLTRKAYQAVKARAN